MLQFILPSLVMFISSLRVYQQDGE